MACFFAVLEAAELGRKPVWSGAPSALTLGQNASYNFAPYASDPQGDTLRFYVDPLIPGYSIDRVTGVLQLANDAASATVRLKVTDRQFSAYHTCSITVNVPNPTQEYLRPTNNEVQLNFTRGFEQLNESVLNTSTFAYSGNPSVGTLEVGLTDTPPPVNGTVTVRYAVAKMNNGALTTSGATTTAAASIRQGTSVIATDIIRTLGGSWVTYSFSFQASAVTDWNDLRFRLVVTPSGSTNQRRGGGIAWVEVQLPVYTPNRAPIFTVEPTTANPVPGGSIQFTAFDPDGDTLVYSLAAKYRSDITIDPNTGLVSIPVAAASTQGDISVLVTDPGGLTDLAICTVTVQASSAAWPSLTPTYLPIIPNAAGFGMNTTAGSGRAAALRPPSSNSPVTLPWICYVTNLSTGTAQSAAPDPVNRIAQGSLRYCTYYLDTGGAPRIVVPLVSGVIDYSGISDNGEGVLVRDNTIVAMQCAPSPGLHVFNLGWRITGSNIVIWHADSFYANRTLQSAFWPIVGGGQTYQNIVYANCGGFWNRDECFQDDGLIGSNYTTNITYWQCLSAEPFGEYGSPNVGLGKTLYNTPAGKNVAILRHAFLHGYERNPMIMGPATTLADSFVYNYGNYGVDIRNDGAQANWSQTTKVNVEANIVVSGPQTNVQPYSSTTAFAYVTNGGVSGMDTFPTGAQGWIYGNAVVGDPVEASNYQTSSRITAAWPAGYEIKEFTVGGANVSNASLSLVRDKGLLILSTVGPRPADRLARVTDIINGPTNKLNGLSSGLGSWYWYTTATPPGSGTYPGGKTGPELADLGSVAQNSISVSDATNGASASVQAYWQGDPVPVTARQTLDGSGYTQMELWLHRRHAQVMP